MGANASLTWAVAIRPLAARPLVPPSWGPGVSATERSMRPTPPNPEALGQASLLFPAFLGRRKLRFCLDAPNKRG